MFLIFREYFRDVKIYLVLHQAETFQVRLREDSQKVSWWGFELHFERDCSKVAQGFL